MVVSNISNVCFRMSHNVHNSHTFLFKKKKKEEVLKLQSYTTILFYFIKIKHKTWENTLCTKNWRIY
jgi:predicted transcriptional regulator